jgi:hypothetical protein
MVCKWLLVGFLLALGGCGSSASCRTACDCPNMPVQVTCLGEWGCNASSACEYSCKNACDSSGVSTCRVDEECNGSICSARKACK